MDMVGFSRKQDNVVKVGPEHCFATEEHAACLRFEYPIRTEVSALISCASLVLSWWQLEYMTQDREAAQYLSLRFSFPADH